MLNKLIAGVLMMVPTIVVAQPPSDGEILDAADICFKHIHGGLPHARSAIDPGWEHCGPIVLRADAIRTEQAKKKQTSETNAAMDKTKALSHKLQQ